MTDIVSATKWITKSIYNGSRDPHGAKLMKDGADDLQFVKIGPKRPFGLRDQFYPYHPAVLAMRGKLHAMGIRTNTDAVPMPEDRHQIRAYLSARFVFLFDCAFEQVMSVQSVQTKKVQKAFQHIAGWDFDIVVAAFEAAWDNPRHGGAGRPAFERLWMRDLRGWKNLYPAASKKQFVSNDGVDAFMRRMKLPNASPSDAIQYIAEDLFELERGYDCLEGFGCHRQQLKQLKRSQRVRLYASVSPHLPLIAKSHPELIKQGDEEHQADLAGETAASLTLAISGLDKDRPLTEPWFLGWNDRGFILHLFSQIGRRKAEQLSRHSDVPEHNILRSRIFRLTINFLAHHNTDRADRYLAKRLNAESHKTAASELASSAKPPLSYFGETTACNDSPQRQSLLDALSCMDVGASYVERLREVEVRRNSDGLSDPKMEPIKRAFFCPDAWTTDILVETLLAEREAYCGPLGLLNDLYASETRKGHLEVSASVAGRLLECMVAPLTLRAFAVKPPVLSAKNVAAEPTDGEYPRAYGASLANNCKKISCRTESGAEKAQKSAHSRKNAKTRTVSKVLLKPG
ncbi:hypothetical protein [Alteripontixanthobacter maritimus]|nr:hypothetical protein [Alteripontixanthobacter maritimus]